MQCSHNAVVTVWSMIIELLPDPIPTFVMTSCSSFFSVTCCTNLLNQSFASKMAMVAAGAGGSGGGPPPWRFNDGLETIEVEEDDLDDEESGEDDWHEFQHAKEAPPGLRTCRKCKYYTYLRKGACANPGCVLSLANLKLQYHALFNDTSMHAMFYVGKVQAISIPH